MTTNTWHRDSTSDKWEVVLEQLKDFEELAKEINKMKKSTPVPTETLDKFIESHNTLVKNTEELSGQYIQNGSMDTSSNVLDNIFVEAVWLSLEQYPAIVHHPDIENIDTAGSKIFTLFTPDSPSDRSAKERVKRQVQQNFTLDSDSLSNLNRKLSNRTAPLYHRHQIMNYLQDNFKLYSDNQQLDEDILRLFNCLYPGAPFVVGEVKLIKTASALYFCLPSEIPDVSTDSDIQQKSAQADTTSKKMPEKKVMYAQFLRKIWQVEPFAHFPVFGTFNAENLDLEFREQIVDQSGLSIEVVTTTLTRMIGVLPLEELDKYLIHDTWGHQWQESLLDFEDLYTELSLFNRPLSFSESASVLGEHTTFAEAFVITESGKIHLDSDKLRTFINAELYERSIIAFTPILAEMLADVVEYKFILLYPEQGHLLPSSSLLKDYPSKLDLTLADLRNCFEQASEVFQTWVDSEEAKYRIHTEICEKHGIANQDLQHTELDEVLEEAVQLCKGELERFYQPEWFWEKADDCLQLNAFSIAALNFLRVHTAFLYTYKSLTQMKSEYGFQDCLVLAMGTFFELEPQRNIWHLDEFLLDVFLPQWKKFNNTS